MKHPDSLLEERLAIESVRREPQTTAATDEQPVASVPQHVQHTSAVVWKAYIDLYPHLSRYVCGHNVCVISHTYVTRARKGGCWVPNQIPRRPLPKPHSLEPLDSIRRSGQVPYLPLGCEGPAARHRTDYSSQEQNWQPGTELALSLRI